MLRFENAATPDRAAPVAVPDRDTPPGFAAIAPVTFPVNVVAVFPRASRAVTLTAGAMTVPATAAVGCTEKTSCAADPAVIVNGALVAVVTPLALARSVYPAPALSMLSVANVATPAAAAIVVVPVSVPPDTLAPIVSVTLPVNPVARLPSAVSADT